MKLNNLLNFSDFAKSWNPEQQKKTKRTEIGLDIIKENKKPTLTKKELQKRVSEEAKRMQQDLKKQGSSWTISQCKKEAEKTFREEFEIKENNEFQQFSVYYSDRVGLLCVEIGDNGVELAKENIIGLEQVFNDEIKKYINSHDNPKIEIKKILFDKINIHSYFVDPKMVNESPVSINLTSEQVEEVLEKSKDYNLASELDFM